MEPLLNKEEVQTMTEILNQLERYKEQLTELYNNKSQIWDRGISYRLSLGMHGILTAIFYFSRTLKYDNYKKDRQ